MALGAVNLVFVEVTLKCLGAGNKRDDRLFRLLDPDHAHSVLFDEYYPYRALLLLLALCDGALLLLSFLRQSAGVSHLLMWTHL